jgi:hypothetical protein
MRKIATMFLLLVSIGLLFGGAVSAAEGTVDVTVVDNTGTDVTTATTGQEVNVDVVATATTAVEYPGVMINIDPATGIEFEVPKATMSTNGGAPIVNGNDPKTQFFYWSDTWGAYVWAIGDVTGDMAAGDVQELVAPAIVTATGPITVNAGFYEWPQADPEPTLMTSDSYTFTAVAAAGGPKVCGKHVPMQETGTPVALAALGLLSIMGGVLYSRLR